MKTKRLARNGVLISMYVVLAMLAQEPTMTFKVTFEAFPLLVAAFLFGPIDGMIVGGLGSFLFQMLKYGFSVTTFLWIMPHMVSGLLVGFLASKIELKRINIILISIASAITVSLLNCIPIYVDSVYYGYYFKGIVFGGFLLKIAIGTGYAIVCSLVLPELIKRFKQKKAS